MPARTHGESRKTPEYRAWLNMRCRCFNPCVSSYMRHGGRGIVICDRWLHSYPNFLEDMGRRPSLKHSLDRIDNDGNYTPENCRWATRTEQNRNMVTNTLVELRGRTQCISAWAEEIGISPPGLYMRLFKLGWSVEKSLTTPSNRARR